MSNGISTGRRLGCGSLGSWDWDLVSLVSCLETIRGWIRIPGQSSEHRTVDISGNWPLELELGSNIPGMKISVNGRERGLMGIPGNETGGSQPC